MKAEYKSKGWHIIPVKLGTGEPGWQVYTAKDKTTGKRFRKSFKVRKDAEDELAKCLVCDQMYDDYPPRFARNTFLTDQEIGMCESAYCSLRMDDTLKDPTCILDAVNFYMDHRRKLLASKSVKLSDALTQFIADKTKSKRRGDTLKNYEDRIGRFNKAHPEELVAAVTLSDVSDFINMKGKGPEASKSDRTVLHVFFAWCLKNGLCNENVVSKTDAIKIDLGEPQVVSLEQATAMLCEAKKRSCLPYVVLSLFCGMRPKEICKEEFSWNAIKLDEKRIVIGADVSKVRGRRVVELSDNAVAWLKSCKGKPLEAERRAFDEVKRAGGFIGRQRKSNSKDPEKAAKFEALDKGLKPYPPDALRHTAISNHYAKCEHEGQTATWGGTSPDVIHRHYKGLVSREDAAKFWAVMP